MEQLLEPAMEWLCRPLFPHEAYMDWLLAGTISLPHFLYAFIWLCPQVWRNAFGKQAVHAFSVAAGFGKVLQFQAVIYWLWSARKQGLCLDPADIQLWQWLAFLLLLAFGQALNLGIYKAIGVDGVYYGCKLGKKVPWVSGFPFNVVPHPQYVGSSLTVWAFAALLYNQVHEGGPLQASIMLLCAYWTLLYVVTGVIEQYF